MSNKIDKSKFEFVSLDEKIFDAKFEGKPRSFLQDAMVRFVKNKVNVVASVIVFLVIILSIFVPVLSTKDYSSPMISSARYLPPRLPLLEKIGIFDGTIDVVDARVDPTLYILIDENGEDIDSNRLYYPFNDKYPLEYIKKGTLTNSYTMGGRKDPAYIGGTNNFVLQKRLHHIVAYEKNQDLLINNVAINIMEISDEGKIIFYLKPNNLLELLPPGVKDTDQESLDYYIKIGETNESGKSSFSLSSPLDGTLVMIFESTKEQDVVKINSVDITYEDIEEVNHQEGYDLSQWQPKTMATFGGSWLRENARMVQASFKYYKYFDIFADSFDTMASSDYYKMIDDFGVTEDDIIYNDEEDHSKGWKFNIENFPIVEVLRKTTPQVHDGVEYYSYEVIVNGKEASIYDEIPYFIFGTDGKGRDLFAEVWLSLRTSLILGLIVSFINIVIGIIWGSISGYFGGRVDFTMERVVEILSSFPGLTILSILYIKFGGGFTLLLLYLTYSGWIGVAGITRIQFYRYRGREYVLASRTLGANNARLIFKHILPNSLGYITTSVVLSVPAMILTEASLSFLGFGLGEGAVLNLGLFKLSGLSLGILLYNGEQNMTAPGRFYMVMIPAIVIIVIMIAFNLFGNALRDALNPSLRGQEE
ncbi:MAG: ABC transporter permease [Acholeplasmataceae bacterium]|nr:ABC transporter permease [Acholeplasmataceae bacterium]MCK9234126.1 ABC transporter permease [Acholeplasmataceae bacterium]MCK9289419.1 ABC transporter permease [Acholeplasmataceae bacterium]MCK9427826.1 ABC transporter permease [Acholeplasmataceae bacterium]HHT38870.1 ABC transporter permease [Acholeplasmataceae bacterium]